MTQKELLPITPRPTTARALMRAHPNTCSKPLISWLEITHVLSQTSAVGCP